MAAKMKLRGYLRSKEGNSAVEFIFTTAMLILTGDLGRSILVQDKERCTHGVPSQPQSPAMLGFFRLKPRCTFSNFFGF